MTKQLALIGGGGHALSLLDILPSSLKVAGYVDITANAETPLPYLGNDDDFMANYPSDKWDVMVTLVSGADCNLSMRRHIISAYGRYTSPIIISPTAIVSDSASICDGTAIFHRAVVNAGCYIGEQCIINTGAIVEHGCDIGDNVFIGPGAILCGGVTIGDNVYIGAGAVIKPGVMISDNSIIGAGAVVIGNLGTPGRYVGVPAKLI